MPPTPTHAPAATEPPKTSGQNNPESTPTSIGNDGSSPDSSTDEGLFGLLGLGAIVLGLAVSTTIVRKKK